MYTPIDKSSSALALKSSEESLRSEKGVAKESADTDKKIVKEPSELLEDHLFCAFIGYFATFSLPIETLPENYESKYVDCSKPSNELPYPTYILPKESIDFDNRARDSKISKGFNKSSKNTVSRMGRRKSKTSRSSYSRKSSGIMEKVLNTITSTNEEEDIKQEETITEEQSDVNYDFIYAITGENNKMITYMKNGLKYDFLNGNTYEGTMCFTKSDGTGEYSWSDGSKYKGNFIGDIPNGGGCMEWADESKFEGQFKNGLRDGRGSFVLRLSPINSTYTGSWSKGLLSGKGSFKMNDINWYEGEFQDGKYNGRGLRHYPSGSKYLGNWKNGKQNGSGIMLFSNNDMYIGDWVDGKMEGNGKYIWNTFLNSQFVFPMHNMYIGEWKDGMRHGIGSLILSTGAILYSVWSNNMKHGWGRILCTNGATIESNPLFVNNVLISFKEALYKEQCIEESEFIEKIINSRKKTPNKTEIDLNLKEDCEFIVFKTCISPVNIPPYFLNIDYHVTKFFELDEWYNRIPSINWCQWSLYMPAFCEIKDNSHGNSDYELEYEKVEKGNKKTVNDSKFIESKCNESLLNMTHKPSTKVNVAEGGIITDDHCVKYTEQPKFQINTQKSQQKLSKWKLSLKSSVEDNVNMKDKIKEIYIFEKKWLRNTIIKHMPSLQKLYYRYATICCKEKPLFEPGLLRVLMWKLLKDVGVDETGFSIVEIDNMAVGKTDPFDFVPISEMIHYLLIIAWEIFTKKNQVNVNIPGMLAGGFDFFVSEKINPIINKPEIYEPLFPKCDTIPIEALYRLFESLGENITIKHLVQVLTRKAEKHYNKHSNISLIPEPNEFFKFKIKGYNGILPGGEIIYISSPFPDFHYIQEEFRNPPEKIDSIDLDFLGILGHDTIINCVMKCFPQLTNKKGEILRQNYEICFLEFLDVLAECIETYLLHIMKYQSNLQDERTIKTMDKCLDQMLSKENTVNLTTDINLIKKLA